jgi:DnaJ-class molecular chaperone
MIPTVLRSTDGTRAQVQYKRTLKELPIAPNTKTGIVIEEELLGEKIKFILVAASTDNFIVQGVDIGTQHYLDVIEAMTETHTMIAYPGGKKLKVKIPKGVKQDQVIRAKGKGLASANGMQGDFMIQFKFSIPEFTEEQRQKLRAIFSKTKS